MYVYIAIDQSKMVKVGIAGCLIKRLGYLNTETPDYPVRLIRAIQVPRYFAFRIERAAHLLIRRKGATVGHTDEWFRVEPRVASSALSKAIKVIGRLHRKWPNGFRTYQIGMEL